MSLLTTPDTLTQPAARQHVESTFGSGGWLTVYEHVDQPMFDGTVFSALIPNDRVPHALQMAGWDLRIGNGGPGFSVGQGGTEYDPWNLHDGVRPLVICRTYHAPVEGAERFELLEEFRLFHNLAYVPRTREYLDVSSMPTTVARWREGKFEIKRRPLLQFLSAKEMHLALFFQLNRRSDDLVDSVPPQDRDVRVRKDDFVYELAVRPRPFGGRGRSFSKLIGKKLVPPLPIEEIGIWPYGGDDAYESFIVAVDAAGIPILHTCDPQSLDYSKPPYPTDTIFFKREVLARYYADLKRYSFDRYRLRCGALWSLELIDDDREGLVYVELEKLGLIPYDEQQHWRAHNVEPEPGGGSAKAYGSPEPSHDFRDAYARANLAWGSAFGWPLFKPLSSDDQHNFDGLRVPLTSSPGEFDGQVLSLAKVAIDSLNEKPIRRAAVSAGHTYSDGAKGIAKLEGLLESKGFDAQAFGLNRSPVDWMKDVQWLRSSGSAHRKSTDYKKVAEHFRFEERGRPAVMRDLLIEGTLGLVALAAFTEAPEADAPSAEPDTLHASPVPGAYVSENQAFGVIDR